MTTTRRTRADADVPKYYAVPDPNTGDMTYWTRNRRGRIEAWPTHPTQAHYGPRLWYKPGPGREHVMPAGLSEGEQREWARTWWETVSKPWHQAIDSAITSNPETAHARFATFSSHCFVCGRALEDEDSKVWGVGPVCRPRLPAALLEETARLIGRLHAEGKLRDVESTMRRSEYR